MAAVLTPRLTEKPQIFKVRLHRGRAMARNWLLWRGAAKHAFPFMGVRCHRVVAAVFARLEIQAMPIPKGKI
jgi:hypothetical protein